MLDDITQIIATVADLDDSWDGNSTEYGYAWAVVDLTQVTLADMLDYAGEAGVDPVDLAGLAGLRGYWLIVELADGVKVIRRGRAHEIDAAALEYASAYEGWLAN